jgi:hypothetical protein
MEVSGQLHAMTNLLQEKETPVGPIADPDMVAERKISAPARNQTPVLWLSN